ncbi:MAG TPA: sulfatase-like hydrolase/transferase [Opitutaceae bacterium]|nr:sulfatase-like hydrolase/transferase [Opitutaceae bacterium]
MSSARPNVVVLLTDQQRWDCAGLHGNPLELMPNFDRLAQAGTHLRHSFTCQPVCAPARSALQTGRYPTQLGTFRNDRALPQGTRTLAHEFKDAGYRTGYIGKWHLAPREHKGAVPPEFRGGYDDWLAANILELVSDAYDCRLYDESGVEHRPAGYRVDAVADAAIRYLATARTQPHFLFVSFLEPHHQNQRDDYPAPVGYAERYEGRWTPPDLAALGGSASTHLGGYYGMVRRLDEALGRITDALKSLGQLDNTILLFTSDHGCHFKTRNTEYKRSCHESSIRVPTMLHGPGFMHGGDRTELVSLIDLPPTLLDAAGVAVPSTMQGRSLMPRLREKDAAWPDDIFVQISEDQTGRALRTARWKYAVSVQGPDAARASDQPGWTSYHEEALFDLEADPHELVNLAGLASHESVAAELRTRLLNRMAQAGEPVPEIIPARQRAA